MKPHLPEVRIIADDLTGALDAAAPFGRQGRPVGLVLPHHPIPAGQMLTISTESRDMTRENACAATAKACVAMSAAPVSAAPLWMKKVDSVLRGHPFAETAQAMQALGLARCVFAPAFPTMGRITMDGHQLVRQGTRWMPTIASDIIAGFAKVGILAARETDNRAKDATVIIIDAERQLDLDAAVRRFADPSAVLWAGSRGLAEALSGPVSTLPSPPLGLVVIGTSHPVTRVQVENARFLLDPAPEVGLLGATANRCLLIDPVPNSVTAQATRQAIHDYILRVDAKAITGRAMLVTGGDTLSSVLEATRAHHLECLGEVSAGIPISIIRGGMLDGIPLVSKSGGYGDPDLIARLIAAPKC